MPESQSRRDEAFEQWFMRVYIERGYVSSKEELREAWKEALRHIASEIQPVQPKESK